MTSKSILDRIRKCLALSRSANEHEAAAALATARRLMDDYGVEEDDPALAGVGETTARTSRNLRISGWEAMLIATIRRAFGVAALLNLDRDVIFIGAGAKPEVAAYAFGVLRRQLRRARADYIADKLGRCKPANKRRRADTFCEGWANGVWSKLAALVPASQPDAAVGRYLDIHHGDVSTTKIRRAQLVGRRAQDDWCRGRIAGTNAQVHHGMGTHAVPLQLA